LLWIKYNNFFKLYLTLFNQKKKKRDQLFWANVIGKLGLGPSYPVV
jgi:hypothetical protein